MSTKIKKSVFIVAICMILTLAFGTSVFAARDAVGDLNRDGVKDELDAIHLLNHYIFDGLLDDFEIDQPSDYNGDGYVDENDAIYLLNNVIFGDLSGLFHICDYPDTWSFVETVKPTCKDAGYTKVKCECGKEAEIMPTEKTDEHNFDWENPDLTHKATCLENGYITATCTVCGEKSVKQQAATGEHDWKGGDCENGATCTLCNSTKPATGHNYSKTPTFVKEATCEGGYKEYACKNEGCTSVHTEALAPTDHRFGDNAWVSTGLRATDKKCTFVYVENAQCLDCHQTFERTTGEVIKHTETTTVTPATCVKPGEKKITCSECGEAILTAEMPVNELAHKFDDGVVNQNVTTYTCQNDGCSHTKTTVKASEDGKVDLKDAEEVELEGGAAIIPDENIKNELGDKEITISIEKVQANDLENLSNSDKELLKQLGDAPIFDLSLTANGEKVTNFGENNVMTVRLPYTLEEGDDPDCIIIWYIGDDGHIDHFEAKYVDGYAVFETNHFSYYTVTRMTPAQRCEYYGQHNYQTTAVPATCITGGYTISICTRCSHQEISDEIPAKGHAFVGTKTPATCDKAGSTVYNCENCTVSYTETIKALGHKCELSKDEYTAPSCTAKGEAIYKCTNTDCEYSYKEVLPQLDHEYEKNVVAPDCENGGYTENECKNCDHSFISGPVSALGHKYVDSVCFVCQKECEHTFEYGVCTICKFVKENSYAPDEDECKHDIIYSYEFLDKKMSDCKHGVIITESCSKCSYTNSYITNECVEIEVNVDLSGYDHCGNHDFSYVTCPCNRLFKFTGDVGIDQEIVSQNPNEIILGCKLCDIYAVSTVSEEMSGCFYAYNQTVNLYFGEQFIHTLAIGFKEAYHDIPDVKYELLDGENCENGVKITGFCKACESQVTSYTFYHVHNNYEKFDFSQYGGCDHHGLTIYSCVCGKDTQLEVYNFDWTSEENCYIDFCKDCNTFIYHYVDDSEPDNQCNVQRVHTFKIVINAQTIKEFTSNESFVKHDYVVSVEKLGDTCDDGFITTYFCQHCGDEYTNETKGHLMEEVRIDLSEYGVCEHHEVIKSVCSECGYVDAIYAHNIGGDGDKYTMVYYCDECPLKIVEIETHSEKDENCHVSFVVKTTLYIGDTILLEAMSEGGMFQHNYQNEYELLGETCHDGVIITSTCLDCGYVNQEEYYDHTIEYFDIFDEYVGGCGSHLFIIGEKCKICDYAEIGDLSLSFEFTETENGEHHFCKKCGIEVYCTKDIVEKDEWCNVTVRTDYVFTVDGVEFARFFQSSYDSYHDYDENYEFFGDSCEDGVLFTRICKNCGDESREEFYSHSIKSTTLTFEEFGACATHRARIYQCSLCNEYTKFTLIGNYTYEPFEGGEKRCCHDCGLEFIRVESFGEKDEFCITEVINNYSLILNGTELFSCILKTYDEIHDLELTFELIDNALGCEGGVNFYNTCKNCGYSEQWTEKDHDPFNETVYNLADHGHTCGTGSITYKTCACGKKREVYVDAPDFDYYPHTAIYDEDIESWREVFLYDCLNCDYVISEEVYQYKDEECYDFYIHEFTFGDMNISSCFFDGPWHFDVEIEVGDESYEEINPDGTTTKVTTTVNHCENCLISLGKSTIIETFDTEGRLISHSHEKFNVEIIDGETVMTLVSSEFNEYIYVECPELDRELRLTTLYYKNNGDGYWDRIEYQYSSDNYCECIVHYTSSMDDDYTYTQTNHIDANWVYAFVEGGTSCTDGIIEQCVCSVCGAVTETSENIHYDHAIAEHNSTLIQTFDLSQYGAKCDSFINIYACLCGERKVWRFQCNHEIDRYNAWLHINGVEHEYEVYSCPVSDCGFKFVVENVYSVDNNCNQIQNATIYFGVSDDNTSFLDTYSFTSLTGEKEHKEYVTNKTVTADRYYEENVCKYCGLINQSVEIVGFEKTQVTYDYFNDGSYNKHIEKWLIAGYDYILLTRREEYDFNGECTFWSHTEYSYPEADNNNYCRVIITISNMFSNVTTREEDSHTWTWDGNPCTPAYREQICTKCHTTRTELIGAFAGHEFMYDDSTGLYVCRNCGLKSEAPGDGLVCFEDKTIALGDGTKYVIGWFNEYGENFVWDLVLIDPSTGAMYPLDGIDISMVNDYTIELDALAIKAFANSLGLNDCEYMVRLSFVPTDSSGELEYAITLEGHVYKLENFNLNKTTTGCEAEWTYKCVICDHSYTEKKGHHTLSTQQIVFSIADDVMTVTEINTDKCIICDDETVYTYVYKYTSNGMLISENLYSDGNILNYSYTYDYDYENGTYTRTYTTSNSTSVDILNLYTGEVIT